MPTKNRLRDTPRALLHELTREPAPPRGATIVVAVSGGGDSVALLHLLTQLAPGRGWRLVVATLDHAQRGAESDADRRFVETIASQLKLPCISSRLRLPSTRPTAAEGDLRERRHRFLRRALQRSHAQAIALAHSRDDQAETVLFRLARGTGLAGVTAMKRWAPPLWRPLLEVGRSRLREWLEQQHLEWREDAGNERLDHARSRIRHRVIPALAEALERDPIPALARFAELAGDDEAFLIDAAEQAARDLGLESQQHELSLDRKRLSRLPAPLARRILRACFERVAGTMSLDADQIAAVLRLAAGSSSGTRASLPGGWSAERSGMRLVLRRGATLRPRVGR